MDLELAVRIQADLSGFADRFWEIQVLTPLGPAITFTLKIVQLKSINRAVHILVHIAMFQLYETSAKWRRCSAKRLSQCLKQFFSTILHSQIGLGNSRTFAAKDGVIVTVQLVVR